MVKAVNPLLFFLAAVLLAGCAATIPHVIVPDYGKRGMRLIAVMPIINSSSDPKSAEMLRSKLVEELYFKGYPKIPVKVIDEKLVRSSPRRRGEGISAGDRRNAPRGRSLVPHPERKRDGARYLICRHRGGG